jgi:photosystem II stability/assembly factor-like uncharacterized protein
VAIDPLSPDVLLAAGSAAPYNNLPGSVRARILRSTDAGNHWNEVLPLPANDSLMRAVFARSPSNPARVYLATVAGKGIQVHRSDDSGTTWVSLPQPSPLFTAVSDYALTLEVDPADQRVVYLGAADFYRSADAGATWQRTSRGDLHVDIHQVAFDGRGFMYVANDGGIARSFDRGVTFEARTGDLAVTQFYEGVATSASDSREVLAGSQDTGLLTTVKGQWTTVDGESGRVLIDPTDPARYYFVHSFFGTPWIGGVGEKVAGIDKSENYTSMRPLAMSPANPDEFTTTAERVYLSTDRMEHWTPISPLLPTRGHLVRPPPTALSYAPSDPSTIYVGTQEGAVHITRDKGATWAMRDAGLPVLWVSRFAVDPISPETVYVSYYGFSEGRVFKSKNAGVAW